MELRLHHSMQSLPMELFVGFHSSKLLLYRTSEICLCCTSKSHCIDDCLIPWLTTRQSCCPLCKFDVLEHINSNSACKETPTGSGEGEPASWQSRMSSFWDPIRNLRGWLPLSMQSGSEEDGSRGGHEDVESPGPAAETEMVPTTTQNEDRLGHGEESLPGSAS